MQDLWVTGKHTGWVDHHSMLIPCVKHLHNVESQSESGIFHPTSLFQSSSKQLIYWHKTLYCIIKTYKLGLVQQEPWPARSPCGWSCVHRAVPAEGRDLGKAAAWAKPACGRTSPDWRWLPPAALTHCDATWTSPPVAGRTATQRDHSECHSLKHTQRHKHIHLCKDD